MGLQLPRRKAGRIAGTVALGAGAVLLGGCSANNEWTRVAMPDPASEQGEHILNLWQGAWIAALITGVITWGLIFWAIWRYRRRNENDIPVQTRYNLPLEIFYTIAPVLMVIVFFAHTVKTQNAVLDDDIKVDNTIEVVGQQWQWTFNYGRGAQDIEANKNLKDDKFAYDEYRTEVGTASFIPTLYLPVDKTTRFNLYSPDVIHDFGIPGFLMRMDVIPGRVNHYAITPTRKGTYAGKCYELCGVHHSRMLFNVKVVDQAEYDRHVDSLPTPTGPDNKPLLGGAEAYEQAGLGSQTDFEGDNQ